MNTPRRLLLSRSLLMLVGFTLAVVAVEEHAVPPAHAESGSIVSLAGSASAKGVEWIVNIPGGPTINDTPVDVGGPTASAVVDSHASNTAFAAFPDPGLFVGGGSLLVGFIATNLPPGTLPPFPAPDYPLFVQAKAGETPSDEVGAGPYRLEARSDDSSSEASAGTGLKETPAGNAALVTSKAAVKRRASGGVAEATSEAEGLTVGPLTIGHLRSTARQTLNPDGSVTAFTALEIDGMRVGRVPVGFRGDDPMVAQENKLLADLLKAANITVELTQARTLPDGAVQAPVLTIVVPFDGSRLGLGTAPGKTTVRLGGSVASISGVAATAEASSRSAGAPLPGPAGGGAPEAQPPAPSTDAAAESLSIPDEPGSATTAVESASPALPVGPAPSSATPPSGSDAGRTVVRSAPPAVPVTTIQSAGVGRFVDPNYKTPYLVLAGAVLAGLALVGARRRPGVEQP
ncbi:MAG TPA: hypothetical protein VHL53_02170 [Acidimicrobiia bacterium]|nr:hypothetical protein [Acidimicrobiia bacterium]